MTLSSSADLGDLVPNAWFLTFLQDFVSKRADFGALGPNSFHSSDVLSTTTGLLCSAFAEIKWCCCCWAGRAEWILPKFDENWPISFLDGNCQHRQNTEVRMTTRIGEGQKNLCPEKQSAVSTTDLWFQQIAAWSTASKRSRFYLQTIASTTPTFLVAFIRPFPTQSRCLFKSHQKYFSDKT